MRANGRRYSFRSSPGPTGRAAASREQGDLVKTCFKCGRTLPVEEFYRHAGMADGCLGKCKGCTRLDVRIWYRRTKAARIKYEVARAQTAKRKVAVLEYQRRRRKRRPEAERAHRL